MRLLLTADTIGGVWTFACELAGALVMRGVDVLLVSFGRLPSASQLADVDGLATGGKLEYIASEVPLEWMPDNATAYTEGAELLLHLNQHFKPEALLLSQFCYGALPVSAHKILIAHSDVLSWADAVGKAPLAADGWLHTYCELVQSGLNGADTIVAPTADMLTCLRRGFQVRSATKVIPNGRTLPRLSASLKRQLRAVSAGRMWDPAKNLSLLQMAELPLPVLVVGENDPNTSVPPSATLLGHLDGDRLLGLLRESAIYICTSLYEPFGLAALEAALCGCAVLANDILSLREVWGEGALYFHDAGTLTALLESLVVDASMLRAAQTRSAARAKQYTAAAMADAYVRLISSCIKTPHAEAERAA